MKSLRYRLIGLYLVLTSRAYYIVSNKGASILMPEIKELLEAVQDELEDFDHYLEQTIMDLILEARYEEET